MVKAGSLDGQRQRLQDQAHPDDRHLCAKIATMSVLGI